MACIFFALNAIFILSCNQNSEEKADHQETKEVSKDIGCIPKQTQDYPHCGWAIKKEPDGTIIKLMRVGTDDNMLKPDGFEWKKVQGESPRKYLKAPSKSEGNLGDGLNTVAGYRPEEERTLIVKITHEEERDDPLFADIDQLDFLRAQSFREVIEYVSTAIEEHYSETINPRGVDDKQDTQSKNDSNKDPEFFEERTTAHNKSIVCCKGEVAGHHVFITISSTSFDLSAESLEEFEDGTLNHENNDSLTDEIKLLIEIDDDKLDLHVRGHEPSETENKGFIYEQSITTKISGDTYPTTNDFFEKLSMLGIIRERWNLDTPTFPLGHSFYFILPHKG